MCRIVPILWLALLTGCAATPVSEIKQDAPRQYRTEAAPAKVLSSMAETLDELGCRVEYLDAAQNRLVANLEHPVYNKVMIRYVIEADAREAGSDVRIWTRPRETLLGTSYAETLWQKYLSAHPQ